jgi:hypothetical protein
MQIQNTTAEGRPVWEGRRDFGNGARLYRCQDITSRLGTSVFERWSDRLQVWRPLNNYDLRVAMHSFISRNVSDPF